jgi:hypothetical protein
MMNFLIPRNAPQFLPCGGVLLIPPSITGHSPPSHDEIVLVRLMRSHALAPWSLV